MILVDFDRRLENWDFRFLSNYHVITKIPHNLTCQDILSFRDKSFLSNHDWNYDINQIPLIDLIVNPLHFKISITESESESEPRIKQYVLNCVLFEKLLKTFLLLKNVRTYKIVIKIFCTVEKCINLWKFHWILK